MNNRLNSDFFIRDTLIVSKELIGKTLARRFDDGTIRKYRIIETEAYCGIEDLACHASKGKTKRTQVMFENGGKIYMYLIYGMYWMLNFVTGPKNVPSAVLIRGLEGFSGPGRVGKELALNQSFYGEDLSTSQKIWIEDSSSAVKIKTGPRIGIDYAGEPWVSKPWRFQMAE